MDNLNLPTARRPRKSEPKTRSGCLTCKARHIRCDQTKPECRNCTASSRKCRGYPALVAGTLSRSNSPHSHESIDAYNIPFKIPGSQSDRQLLHYYCCQAAWNLSSYGDSTLWTELILQRAQDQPVIRNGLVTLSSLHKDFVSGVFPSEGVPKAPSTVATMTMLSKCYTQLSNYLARADSTPDIALICSVLFYSLESLLGDSRQAISHLDSGLTLLKRIRYDPKWMADPLIVRLVSLFERLDIQASSYDDGRVPYLELVSHSEMHGIISVVPDSLHDVNHAEHVLARLQNWTLRQIISNVELKGRAAKDVPSDLLCERLVLLQQFERYRSALNGLGSALQHLPAGVHADKAEEDASRLQKQRYLLLQTQSCLFHYLIKEHAPVAPNAADGLVNAPVNTAQNLQHSHPPPLTTEGQIDRNDDDLDIALSKILELLSIPGISAAQSPNAAFPLASSSQRTYTLSTFLVAELYFLCLKTTNQAVLSTAHSLFSHPLLRNARDGLWDARLAELVVTNVIKLRDRSTALSDKVQSRDRTFSTPNLRPEDRISALAGANGLKTSATDHYPQIRPERQTQILSRGASLQQPEVSAGVTQRNPNRLEEFGLGIVDVEGGVEEAARRISLISL